VSAAAPYDLDVGFDRLYGLRITELRPDQVIGEVIVQDQIKQPAGLVHGGVYAAIAESMATNGTAAAVYDDGNTAVGMTNQTSFLRPITQGTIHATARARHRGRTTWVWEVELRDDEDRLCGMTRVTVAVRPRPAARPHRPR
jgi:1,4-dihydroxy-2-naphthoyl-CoA hydrolase